MKNQQTAGVLFFDFVFSLICFCFPLLIFPEKSKIGVQLALGVLCELMVWAGTKYNRLTMYRDVLPLIERLYGPVLGLMITLFNLAFLSFFIQSYQFSRYVNGLAFLSMFLYLLLSRRILFGGIQFLSQPKGVGPVSNAVGQSHNILATETYLNNDSLVYELDLEKTTRDPGVSKYLTIKGDPFAMLLSRICFVQGRPYLNFSLSADQMHPAESIVLMKRLFDILFSFFLFVLFLPVFFLISVLTIVIEHESPFFQQLRYGKNGKVFSMLKFKTFFGSPGRVTVWGRLLRRSNLDELLQLINVIKGDMSLVGPRAEIVEKMNSAPNEIARSVVARHAIRPGITGYWQLSPHRGESISEHMEYDLYYILTRSFLVDGLVICLTPFFAFTNNRRK
jgi:undecaprenyl phosphate N,N'-diacetylbacillosamine 1-phosphate transferase